MHLTPTLQRLNGLTCERETMQTPITNTWGGEGKVANPVGTFMSTLLSANLLFPLFISYPLAQSRGLGKKNLFPLFPFPTQFIA